MLIAADGFSHDRHGFGDPRGHCPGRHPEDIGDLLAVVELLAEHGELPAAYRAHKLTGDWKGVWECHIEPDWLLIYDVTPNEILLIRTGMHRDLFS